MEGRQALVCTVPRMPLIKDRSIMLPAVFGEKPVNWSGSELLPQCENLLKNRNYCLPDSFTTRPLSAN